MMPLGDKIRELREKKDISLRELSRKIARSAAFVSDIELGRRYPSDDVFKQIAEALDISVDELRNYDPRPPIEDLKRLTASNPVYGIALRKIIDKDITPEEIMRLADQKQDRKKKK